MTPASTFLAATALLFCAVAGYVVGYLRGLAYGSGVALSAIDAEMERLRART